ncbi:DUF3397 family protein [Fervidibacillus albus]|uniref:DUF3397 domain-containing protein n=1 Tax=Fervidibacillus albus TaxID=2980026 RepID=A0A9E8RWZ7_9BACI|nr:DUF3397 family protein [Fervidibacillus albus]WAA10623.1 DUF3397 domain-containing protein [Fervidibacillus albus]
MAQFLSGIITLFIVSPIIFFVLLYFIIHWRTKDTTQSAKKAADGSVPFFLLSVYFLAEVIWGKSFLFFYILLFLFLFSFFVYFHWRKNNRIDLKSSFHKFWRFIFLLLIILHFLLMTYGIVSFAFRQL